MELNKINGSEILEFLNSKQKSEDFEEISPNGFHFEDQEVKDGRYKLTFMSYYNNWGTDQEINDNHICIYENGIVKVSLEEPFEGDGSDDVLEECLTEWLKTHTFNENPEAEFQKLINTGKQDILEIKGFEDKKKIVVLIELLKKSLTHIK